MSDDSNLEELVDRLEERLQILELDNRNLLDFKKRHLEEYFNSVEEMDELREVVKDMLKIKIKALDYVVKSYNTTKRNSNMIDDSKERLQEYQEMLEKLSRMQEKKHVDLTDLRQVRGNSKCWGCKHSVSFEQDWGGGDLYRCRLDECNFTPKEKNKIDYLKDTFSPKKPVGWSPPVREGKSMKTLDDKRYKLLEKLEELKQETGYLGHSKKMRKTIPDDSREQFRENMDKVKIPPKKHWDSIKEFNDDIKIKIDIEKYIERGEKELSSGITSHIYYNFRKITDNDKETFSKILRDKWNGLIVGIKTMGYEIANKDQNNNVVWYDPHSNELEKEINEDYVLFDDVITTYKSINKAIMRIGRLPNSIFCLVNRMKIEEITSYHDIKGFNEDVKIRRDDEELKINGISDVEWLQAQAPEVLWELINTKYIKKSELIQSLRERLLYLKEKTAEYFEKKRNGYIRFEGGLMEVERMLKKLGGGA